MGKYPYQGKTQNLKMLSKHGISVYHAQVLNSLILKMKDVAIFAGKFAKKKKNLGNLHFFLGNYLSIKSPFALKTIANH